MGKMTNFTAKINDNRTYMSKSGCIWLKVFYHNCENGDFFNTRSETLEIYSKNKFSILGLIDSTFKINGKYEFLLEVPGQLGYNRWRQSVHPKDTTRDATEEINGYEPVKLSWKSCFYGGLSYCSSGNAYFDCSAGNKSGWWYPIGSRFQYKESNLMPLIYDTQYYGTEIKLWVRVPPLSGQEICFTQFIKRRHADFNCLIFVNLLMYSFTEHFFIYPDVP